MIDLTICCEECGKELKADWTNARGEICVSPCKTCLDEAHDDGKKAGRAEEETP